jgi:hypothetical protein
MSGETRLGRQRMLGIGVPALALIAVAYVRFGFMRSLREDKGFELNVRRWTPIATEFRMRQVRLARAMIRLSRRAEQMGLLTSPIQRSLEAGALRLVRCESRPVYSSGRRGEWGDTGARWQPDDAL